MPVLFRDTVTRQPQYNAGIDTGHPIGRRIVAALDPRWSLTGKQISIVGSGYSVLPRTSGMAAIGNNASLMSEQFPGIAFPFTQIVVMGKITRTTNNNVSAGPGDNSGNQFAGFQFSSGSGVDNRFLLRATNSASGDSSYRAFSANATTASAHNIVLGANVVSNSSIDVYWNGLLDNGTFGSSGGGPSTGSPTWGRLAIGGIDRGTDIYADTGNDAGLIFIVAGLLTSTEQLSLAINPWQIHRPPARKLWLMGAASGGTDYPVTRTESADASDTASLTIIYAATAAEIAEATSAHAAAMAAAVSIAETGEATSTQAAVLTAFVSINETGAATDSSSTAGLYGVTVAEASDAADVASAIRALFGTTSETGAATDTSSASLPGLYSVTVVEAANAEDAAAQAMSALVVIAEALAAADVANWVGAVIYTRAPRGGGYPATVQTTERYGTTNTKRPAMTNTRR